MCYSSSVACRSTLFKSQNLSSYTELHHGISVLPMMSSMQRFLLILTLEGEKQFGIPLFKKWMSMLFSDISFCVLLSFLALPFLQGLYHFDDCGTIEERIIKNDCLFWYTSTSVDFQWILFYLWLQKESVSFGAYRMTLVDQFEIFVLLLVDGFSSFTTFLVDLLWFCLIFPFIFLWV